MRGPTGPRGTVDPKLHGILNDIPRIVGDPKAGELVVHRAEELGKLLKEEDLKMAQVRTIFDELRQIKSIWMQRLPEQAIRRLHLLKPKLAYQTARVSALKALAKVLEEGVDAVVKAPAEEQRAYFQRLMEFMEAVVAYHKAYGG